jgi:hypothetical protein
MVFGYHESSRHVSGGIPLCHYLPINKKKGEKYGIYTQVSSAIGQSVSSRSWMNVDRKKIYHSHMQCRPIGKICYPRANRYA